MFDKFVKSSITYFFDLCMIAVIWVLVSVYVFGDSPEKSAVQIGGLFAPMYFAGVIVCYITARMGRETFWEENGNIKLLPASVLFVNFASLFFLFVVIYKFAIYTLFMIR